MIYLDYIITVKTEENTSPPLTPHTQKNRKTHPFSTQASSQAQDQGKNQTKPNEFIRASASESIARKLNGARRSSTLQNR